MRHSQKMKELERRRRRGARLLAGGESQAEVARRVGVSRQTVPRIAQLIETRFSVKLVPSSVWRLLGRLGWSVQRPMGHARERDERAVRTWEGQEVAGTKKIAARQGRVIVFIDESGLSERPCWIASRPTARSS